MIYTLTNRGIAFSKTPTQNISPGWRVVYFLARHSNTATDDQIADYMGGNISLIMSKLVREKVVTAS